MQELQDHSRKNLDPDYFNDGVSWKQRLDSILGRVEYQRPFKLANAQVVPRVLAAEQPGLRAVINMGGHSLCKFIEEKRYRNAHERPRLEEGIEIKPSPRRIQIDRLVFGDEFDSFYFAAVSLGGIGCRFYGEFCVVLNPARSSKASIFDRNSYDLASPPFSLSEDKARIVAALKGAWNNDLIPMLTARIMPELSEENRLTTPGQISDLILRDEDFSEVHLQGSITTDHVEEVRKSPEETAIELEIGERFRSGEIPSPEELVWVNWRHRVNSLLRENSVKSRVVALNGRGFRWR
jgi:hypothetical protein